MSFGVWVGAGVLVGALGAGALLVTGVLDREDTGARPDSAADAAADQTAADQDAAADQRAEDAAAFVDAYEASRLGTYVVESTFRRTLAAGGGFTSEVTVAQRPPDRLERRAGSVSGRVDGRVVLCRTAAGRFRCQSGPAERSYRALVRDEVEVLASYLGGAVPLYAVTATEGDTGPCFDLEQVRSLPAPPYGAAARFCFDEGTAAPTYLRVVRAEATDVTEATDVRATVRDRDLAPPGDGDRAEPEPAAED